MGNTLGDAMDTLPFGQVGYWTGSEPKDIAFRPLKPVQGGYAPHQEGEQWHLGVQWDEPRDIAGVGVILAGGDSAPKVQYWQRNWPAPAPERLPGARHAWLPVDDLYNGQWVDVHAEVVREGERVTYAYDPLDIAELPKHDSWWGDVLSASPWYEARTRRTLKLRLVGRGQAPDAVSFAAYSDAVWGGKQIDVYFGCGEDRGRAWQGTVEAFNGRVEIVEALDADGLKGIRLDVCFAAGADGKALGPESPQRTIVTLLNGPASFSFHVADVAPGRSVFVPDLGVMAVFAGEKPDWRSLLERAAQSPSLYDRVLDEPEQTLARAFAEIPPLDVTKQSPFGRYLPLSMEGARQEFAVRYNGNVVLDKRALKVAGRDTARLLWPHRQIRYNFGTGDPVDWRERAGAAEQTIEEDYLPIVTTRWCDRDIEYTQVAFVAPLREMPRGAFDLRGDEDMVLFARIAARNATDGAKTARLWLNVWPGEQLSLEGDNLVALGRLVPDRPVKRGWKTQCYPEKRLRAQVETARGGCLRLANSADIAFTPPASESLPELEHSGNPKSGSVAASNSLLYEANLEEGGTCAIVYRIPFATLTKPEEWQTLASLDFDDRLQAVRGYWRGYVDSGASLALPDGILADFFRAVRTHVAISVDRDPGSGYYIVPAGTWNYGACGNEACLQIRYLDYCGYHERAEKYLETFIATQGLQPLDGNFQSKEGTLQALDVYNGEFIGRHFSYNLDHGFILECLADHYRLSGDRAWLERVVPNLIAACDFVTRERQATRRLDESGRRVLEYGLLPVGHLEDNPEWLHWFAVNAHAHGGMRATAEVLADIGHPEAGRIAGDAADYRDDIRAAVTRARVNSPVVRLRDGTYVPHIPPRTGLRGRDYGWIRETGYGPLHLEDGRVLDPLEMEVTWILKDLEDNLFVSWAYGWATDVERYWFSRGGVTVQANLLNNIVTYLRRGQSRHAVRSLFNDVGLNLYRDVLCSTEHPVVEPGHGVGPNYKTPDECGLLCSLRRALVYEIGDVLHLGLGFPVSWLEPGEEVRVDGAATNFGPLSVRIAPSLTEEQVAVEIALEARRQPASIELHLRHPDGRSLQRVWVDEEAWGEFDAARNLVRLPGDRKSLKATLFYE